LDYESFSTNDSSSLGRPCQLKEILQGELGDFLGVVPAIVRIELKAEKVQQQMANMQSLIAAASFTNELQNRRLLNCLAFSSRSQNLLYRFLAVGVRIMFY
jgi:hypothetical protein